MNGVVIVDKPAGMTSHDVVQRVRRAAGTSRVGHAGTLDPMATGVLVVMIGEATKLGPYLTASDKAYRARVQLGAATDTLDAEGQVTASAPLPAWWSGPETAERIELALAGERARSEQIPPQVSAIKIDGRPAHARARRGETVTLEPRTVTVHELALLAFDASGSVDLTLQTSKGYYVRALARDLGEALGCPAHLTALRRTASGPFAIERARPLAALVGATRGDDEALREALIDLPHAAALALPVGTLTAEGVRKARAGQVLDDHHFHTPPEVRPYGGAICPSGWIDDAGRLVAIGVINDGKYMVLRGFS